MDPFPVADDVALHGQQLNFLAGLRSFEDSGFGRLDEPVLLAVDFCTPMELKTMRFEGGLHYTYDDADGTSAGQDVNLKGTTLELSAGLNYALELARFRPYLGFGGSLLWVKLRGIDEDVDVVFDDSDVTAGGYAKAGLLFQLTRAAHVGIEYRHFEGGQVSLDGTDLSTNYDQFALVFGASF